MLILLLPIASAVILALVALLFYVARARNKIAARNRQLEEDLRLAREDQVFLEDMGLRRVTQNEGVERAEERVEYWERRFNSMLTVVEGILTQRDRWKDMYNDSVAAHLEGQAMLEQEIIRVRAQLSQVIRNWNAERQARDEKPITSAVVDLEGEPLGRVEAYLEKIRVWSQASRDAVEESKKELDGERALWEEHIQEVFGREMPAELEVPAPAPPG